VGITARRCDVHKIGRRLVSKLNNSPQMQALSRLHPNATAAAEAFCNLMELAEQNGVVVLPVIGGGTRLEGGTEHFSHPLALAGTEDEPIDDSTLVRQVYKLPHGSVEVTAYFS
jgi:hypothetical protein